MTKRQWVAIALTEALSLFVAFYLGLLGLFLVPETGLFGSVNSTGDRLLGAMFLALAAIGAMSGWLVAARMRRSPSMALAAVTAAVILWVAALAVGTA